MASLGEGVNGNGRVVWEGFANNGLDPWRTARGDVSVVADGGATACRMSGGNGGARIEFPVPAGTVDAQRLRITLQYRLTDPAGGSSSPAYMEAGWKVAKGPLEGLGGYHHAEFPPTEGEHWEDFETIIDFSSTVRDASINILVKESAAALELRQVKMVAAPQRFIPVENAPRLRKGKLLFEDNFDGDLANWVLEGAGTAEIKDGRLHVHVTEDMSERRGQCLWLTQPLPSDIIVEMSVKPISPTLAENRPANLLYFISANRTGGDLLGTVDERKGIYRRYTASNADVPCYSVTWYRINDPYFLIARKNPGWHDLGRNFAAIPAAGKDHELVIEKKAGTMLFVEDGVCSLLVEDPAEAPLAGGYFALRAWHATASYDYVRIYEAAGDE